MPPRLPDEGHGDFAGQLRLTDAEIGLIGDWVEGGAAQGHPAGAPAPPQSSEAWQLGTPDLVLEAAAPVTVPASDHDVFWTSCSPRG